jgi:uncharacterized protein YijF (DUF1287 family)
MLKLGPEHAVVFRLVAEVRDIEHMEIAIEEVVNRDGKKAFASYWGRWLNQRSAERGSD